MQWERSTHVVSIASDFVSNGYDWCFPAPESGRLLEEEEEDDEADETNPQQVTIELTSTSGDSTKRLEDEDGTNPQPVTIELTSTSGDSTEQ
jgi:spore germination protein YaaH